MSNPIHPNLDPLTQTRIVQSEIEGGVFLRDVPDGGKLEVETKSRVYTIHKIADRDYRISGHPKYCPGPTRAYITGSTFGGSLLKAGFIGRGMRLEFSTDEHDGTILTSIIHDVREAK